MESNAGMRELAPAELDEVTGGLLGFLGGLVFGLVLPAAAAGAAIAYGVAQAAS